MRLRPGLIFKRDAASEFRRLFAGPFLPGALANPRFIPALPLPRGLRVQAVHGADVAEAYRLAVTDDRARGAYNVVAEPVLDRGHARPRARRAPRPVAAGRRPHARRTSAGAPGSSRPRRVGSTSACSARCSTRAGSAPSSGGSPVTSATDALLELLAGLRGNAGFPTPPLAADAGGPGRIRELLTGVGARNP